MIRDSKVVELLLQRAWHAHRGRSESALETYAEILAHEDASGRQRAIAAINAGVLLRKKGDVLEAVWAWDQVETFPGVPFFLSCMAWMDRGSVRYRLGDAAGAVCDFTAASVHASILETHQEAVADAKVHVPQHLSPLEMTAQALVDRGRARGYLGDDAGAQADIAAAHGTPGVSDQVVGRGWARLTEVHLWAGRYAQVPEAALRARQVARWPQDLRVLAGFALLAAGRLGEAVYECDKGLPWVRSVERLDYLAAQLEGLLRQGAHAHGAEELRDRLRWRRDELERYAPLRESDTDW